MREPRFLFHRAGGELRPTSCDQLSKFFTCSPSPSFQASLGETDRTYAPEVLLGLLLYGYATGVFSSRKIERATYEAVPFRFIAGNLHPDHDTLATFRHTFLQELKDLFVQVLLLAQEAGVLKLGTISLDGTKIHADASKHNAVSYKRLLELELQLRVEVEELFFQPS